MSPIITWFPSTAGLTRETAPSTPSYSEILCDQMSRPLSFSTAKRLPPQSGKYTAFPSTVGVAETSPPVVNTHFGVRPLTLAGLMECSAGWLQVLLRFWPAIRHWPDFDSDDWLCAVSPATNRRILTETAFASNTSRFFMRTSVVLLEFGAITHTSTAHVYCGHLKVVRIEELQLLLDSGTTCRMAFCEKKPHTHSDLINAVDSVEFQQSRCGVKATRSVARLDVIAFSRSSG